jgi:hypothetical protein
VGFAKHRRLEAVYNLLPSGIAKLNYTAKEQPLQKSKMRDGFGSERVDDVCWIDAKTCR